ncbi:uncharacterized protein LOC110029903 [Phalaenopsis equestris]|uniref:uncharacterized protein LOC110029903 n=1 Tax=Phalaenopsis equestris TaxID=78828 RepID=UPI0009E30739|nr:uncharacterized protein LOC110029903 [Phalaenopsis equestris]
MAKTMEEFSFPEVSVEQDSHEQLSFPHFASSPIWFQSSTSYHKFTALNHHDQRRRSFPSMEDLRIEEVKDEERMDMLWEDFNEELHQIPRLTRNGGREGLDWSGNSTKLDGKRHGAGNFLCLKAVRRCRPGLMIMLKVLKTLLMIQKIRKTRRMPDYHI